MHYLKIIEFYWLELKLSREFTYDLYLPQYHRHFFHPHVIFGRHYGIKKLAMWQITVWQIGFY